MYLNYHWDFKIGFYYRANRSSGLMNVDFQRRKSPKTLRCRNYNWNITELYYNWTITETAEIQKHLFQKSLTLSCNKLLSNFLLLANHQFSLLHVNLPFHKLLGIQTIIQNILSPGKLKDGGGRHLATPVKLLEFADTLLLYVHKLGVCMCICVFECLYMCTHHVYIKIFMSVLLWFFSALFCMFCPHELLRGTIPIWGYLAIKSDSDINSDLHYMKSGLILFTNDQKWPYNLNFLYANHYIIHLQHAGGHIEPSMLSGRLAALTGTNHILENLQSFTTEQKTQYTTLSH